MRERLLAVPAVKREYDAKLAEDPELATDDDKRSQFFRSIGRELSPFVIRQSSKEALEKLLAAVQKPAE